MATEEEMRVSYFKNILQRTKYLCKKIQALFISSKN